MAIRSVPGAIAWESPSAMARARAWLIDARPTKPMPCGSALTAADSLSLDSKRWALGASPLPWRASTSSLKVS
ncbi:hypothetical protein D3C76_1255690 [compost metagenome]